MRDHHFGWHVFLLASATLAFSHCNWVLDWGDDRPGVCPNGVLEGGETCDGTDLGGQTCVGLGYTGGTLTCRDDCTLDPGECTRCGDDVAEGEEECDGEDYRQVTCSSLDYYGGSVNCSESCELILLGCLEAGKCGDSTLQPVSGEVCDTENLDGQVCHEFARWAGELGCNDHCNQFDTSFCTTVAYVAAGTAHTCVVDDASVPFCWGDNRQGQAGAGIAHQLTSPLQFNVVPCASGAQVLAGFDTTCFYCYDTSELSCFGDNRAGQLGLGDLVSRGAAASIPEFGGQDWVRIAIGADHLCGVVGFGDVVCSGGNAHGQLGTGDSVDSTVFVPVAGPSQVAFSLLASGDGFTCAIDEVGHLWCWGRGDRGQLGDGSTLDRLQPVELTVPEVIAFTWISAGTDHVCALDDMGAAWCWGAGENGRLGDGQTGDRLQPVAVHMPPETMFNEIACHGRSCCAVETQGRLYCWGANDTGQLGIGAGADRSEPIAALLPGSQEVTTLAMGGDHACAFCASGSLFCWGLGTSGQLGQGDLNSSSLPVRVVP